MNKREIIKIDSHNNTTKILNKYRKKKVAAYARVSTNFESQQNSILAQQEYFTSLISNNADWEFVGVYSDVGLTGVNINRVAFNQMIEEAISGKIDLILTKSISRFCRNTVDLVSIVRKLKEYNVEVYFERENLSTLSSEGELVLTMLASVAQEEARAISENVTWAIRKRFSEGKVSIPYKNTLGFDKGNEKYTIVVNEEQAVVVKKIYLYFLMGYSPTKISKMLMEENILPALGRETWHANGVRYILTNEKYKGDALLQKNYSVDFISKKRKKNNGRLPQYYIKNNHEAIISPRIFDHVQELIKEDKTRFRKNGVCPFIDKTKCGACERGFGVRRWHSTTYGNEVLQCLNHKNCKTIHIYKELFYYSIYSAMGSLIKERKIEIVLGTIIKDIVSDDKYIKVEEWFRNIEKYNLFDRFLDDNDLSIVIKCITIYKDNKLVFELIDGKKISYILPQYTPKRGFYY